MAATRKLAARRDVLWTVAAQQDLYGVVDFISADDRPLSAQAVLEKLQAQAEKLDLYAERGRRMPEIGRTARLRWRELIVSPWRLIYSIEGDTVLVVGVVDSRRDVRGWLAKRMTL